MVNDMQEPVSPVKVISKHIPRELIAKNYLKAEMHRLFPKTNVKKTIDKLGDKELWRLLEAMSFSFRLNGMFWFISDSSVSWSEEVWNIDKLTLTGMKPAINKVIYSEEVNRNPFRMRDYLLRYFDRYPSTDPEGLGQFRPNGIAVKHSKIFLRENGGKMTLLDGSNRLIKYCLEGKTEVTAYVGRKNGTNGKIMIGDSTFWLLRKVYGQVDANNKEIVLSMTKILMELSEDGRGAIEEYWINHVDDPVEKEIGARLLVHVEGK